MRYLLLRYLRKPNGQMDEVMSVAKRLTLKDHQSSAVILDFKTCQVIQATLQGTTIPKDFDRIVQYYHQYYASIIQRLFNENGWDYQIKQFDTETVSARSADDVDNPGPLAHKS